MSQKKSDAKIVLIGAGSVSFGLSTLGDLMTIGYEELNGATITLHDLSEKNLQLTTGVFKKALQEASDEGESISYKVESSTDLNTALDGANYIIMSIEHGNRIKHWMQDYYIPRKYGSRQVYGENGGPGGAFHTWRQVPPMLNICKSMEDICPDAWLFNYSNPMSRVTWAMNKVSKIKKVGLCHGISSGMHTMAKILGTKLDNIDFTSAGLNHFYFIINSQARNDFEMPSYLNHKAMKIKEGTNLIPLIKERGISFFNEMEKPFLVELLQLYGHLTYPGQSHPGEYVSWADCYCASEKYDFAAFARSGNIEKEKLAKTMEGKIDNYWWVRQSGERAIKIIAGIEHDTGHYEHAVNVQNNGSIEGLIDECCVEVPAIIDKNGIHPKKIGKMPMGIIQMLQKEVATQELVVEAAITGDHNTAIQALTIDGTVPNPQIARLIFSEMLKLQIDYLPQFNKSK